MDYRCAMCDTQVSNAKVVFCMDCKKARAWMNRQSDNLLKCLACNTQLTGSHRKYCSHSCWYTYIRDGRPRERKFNGRRRIDRKPRKECQICGKVSYRMGRSLCDGACASEYHKRSVYRHSAKKGNRGFKLHPIEWY